MTAQLYDFLIHWGVMSLSLWVASHIFRGLTFSSHSALLVAALLASLLPAFRATRVSPLIALRSE